MALFTFVLDYCGGTYVHQVDSPGPGAAMMAWASTMPLESIPSLCNADRAALLEAMRSESPQQVNGTRNVWCVSAIVGGHLALAHVVETVP